MSFTAGMAGKRVSVITFTGRHLVGTLESSDQLGNIVLSSCVERVYPLSVEGVHALLQEQQQQQQSSGSAGKCFEEDALGVMLVRGADVMCLGAVDTVAEIAQLQEQQQYLEQVRGSDEGGAISLLLGKRPEVCVALPVVRRVPHHA